VFHMPGLWEVQVEVEVASSHVRYTHSIKVR
jgi:hypothetical protein